MTLCDESGETYTVSKHLLESAMGPVALLTDKLPFSIESTTNNKTLVSS